MYIIPIGQQGHNDWELKCIKHNYPLCRGHTVDNRPTSGELWIELSEQTTKQSIRIMD